MEPEYPIFKDRDTEVARLNLSGERVIVGRQSTDVILHMDSDSAIYFNKAEALLLIAALNAALEE